MVVAPLAFISLSNGPHPHRHAANTFPRTSCTTGLADLQRVCSACTAFPVHRRQDGSVVVRAEPRKEKQKDIAMAQAVRTQFNATFGIGVTGVPGPGERAGKPVGLAYFAIASAETVHTQEMRVAPRRITLKRRVSNAALIELSKLLRGDLRPHIEAHW